MNNAFDVTQNCTDYIIINLHNIICLKHEVIKVIIFRLIHVTEIKKSSTDLSGKAIFKFTIRIYILFKHKNHLYALFNLQPHNVTKRNLI